MSFLDRLKSFFSGGEGTRADDRAGVSQDEPRAGETNLDASLGVPPSPVDPLGTTAPEAAPEPPAPPPDRDER